MHRAGSWSHPSALISEDRILRRTRARRTQRRGERTELELSAEADDQVVLSVVDHGSGVPPEVREKIFERFFRGHRQPRERTAGTGGRLGITQSDVRIAGHAIEVRVNASLT